MPVLPPRLLFLRSRVAENDHRLVSPQRAQDEWADAILELEQDWATWVCTLFSRWLTAPFAPHHQDFWRHVWGIQRGVRPAPFVGVWNRGGAKSSSAEMALVALGATGRRRYFLYVDETQDQADDHLANIGGLLESPEMAAFYPGMATRRVGKYGPRAWRRNRLWTASGFVVDALGLDKAVRGVKLEAQRPDGILLDDLDAEDDTLQATDKKIRTLTKKILPAGAPSTAVIAIQNLVHENGIFARLADSRADFLVDRVVSGPVPAVEDLEVAFVDERWTITGGRPTWAGMGLAECQAKMDEWGFSAFLSEAQHETEPPPGGIFDHLDFEALRVHPDDVPELVDVVCWCDPAVTDTDSSDSHGVQVDGLGVDNVIYRLYSWEQRATPQRAIRTAIRKAAEFWAGYVGIETDQGGETWGSVFREAAQAVAGEIFAEMAMVTDPAESAELEELLARVEAMSWRSDKAGAGHGPKRARAQRMLARYERPGLTIRHVLGTHATLERALKRFPKTKPLDLVDAAYYGVQSLAHSGYGETAADAVISAGSWRRH